jgi:hypothetical protein
VLLAKEPHTIQYLSGSSTGGIEALSELGVFALELFDALRVELGAARSCIYRLHPGFCLKRPASEARELITKMSHEPLELLECFDVRTFYV